MVVVATATATAPLLLIEGRTLPLSSPLLSSIVIPISGESEMSCRWECVTRETDQDGGDVENLRL